MLWEEHPIYFTKSSFYNAFKILGYKVLDCKKYIYPQEDALVFRLKKYNKINIKKENINKDIKLEKYLLTNVLVKTKI